MIQIESTKINVSMFQYIIKIKNIRSTQLPISFIVRCTRQEVNKLRNLNLLSIFTRTYLKRFVDDIFIQAKVKCGLSKTFCVDQ